MSKTKEPPFKGLRVLELGTVIAGPFATSLLADMGASVIKVEAPGAGDALRNMGPKKNGVPIWWGVSAREKRCITLNLKSDEGKELFRKLVAKADVLVENFRPGTLERLDLGWQALQQMNPKLVLLSISGFGNSGPNAHRPGFGKIAESMSGLVSLTGNSDDRPLFVGYSLADTSAGLFGALGVAIALYNRDVLGGTGARIDLALYEPILRMVDRQFVERAARGASPNRAGSEDPYSYGYNDGSRPVFRTLRTLDADWVMVMIDRSILPEVSKLVGSADLERDDALAAWAATRSTDTVREALITTGASIVPVLDAAGIATSPYFRKRGDVQDTEPASLGPIQVPGHLGYGAGERHRHAFRAPTDGEDTVAVLSGELGIPSAEIMRMRDGGVI
ncbi:CaiB/BaiF CoA transferase family protein [Devosia naphthalenivorans]|uniref:CaiB/BaiF CoA transferase family protein n=1 Tax=Devosia naphthalenivorans TaxID=2082392 RepID=UPI000D3573AD|nr:CoA transferase [Devosia naphthalenivorans]